MRLKFTIFFLIIGLTKLQAQEGQFSQYFAASSLMNPAFSGVLPNLSFNANYKQGGRKASTEYVELIQATFNYPFKRVTSKDQQIGGAGMTFFREKRGFQGVYTSQKIMLSGAYRFKLSQLHNQYVIFGLQGGVVQNKLDDVGLRWGTEYNRYLSNINSPGNISGYTDGTGENLDNTTVFYPVFNFGLIYASYDNENFYVRDKSFLAGISVDNLNRPEFSSQSQGARKQFLFKAFASAKLTLAPRWFIHPSTYILYSNGSQQVNAGLYFSTLVSSVRSRTSVLVQFGSWYRIDNSFLVLAGVEIENLRIGGSFDLNTQSVDVFNNNGSNLPTYEISLTYNLDLSNPLRHIPSPIL